MEFLEKNKSETFKSKIDHTKQLSESHLKDETKNILAMIYMKYWCTDDEKKEYEKILNENEKKYQKEIKEKYNPDNLFYKPENVKNKETEKQISEQENIEMVKYKKTFL